MNNNELKHYGVLGMKWGLRRYQNYDGTLTPEGREHVKGVYVKAKNKADKLQAKADKYTSKSSKAELKFKKANKKYNKELIKRTKNWNSFIKSYTDGDTIKKSKLDKTFLKSLKTGSKFSKLEEKADKYQKKVNRWLSAMDKEFSKINYSSIPEEDILAGEAYASYILSLDNKRK